MIKDLIKKGFYLKKEKHYKQAIEVFYKVLEQDNKSAEVLMEIAELYYLINNEEKALNYIEQIIKINEMHIGALKLLEQIFLDKKAYKNAEQTSENIYKISHSDEDLLDLLILLNYQQKFEDVTDFAINTENSDLVCEKAKALIALNKADDAIQLIKFSLEKNDKDQKLNLLIANLLLSYNDIEKCKYYANRLDYNEKSEKIMNFWGKYFTIKQDYQKAEKAFITSIKLNPDNSENYFGLANCYFSSGKTDAAKKYYNLAISYEPENRHYHYALAKLYYLEKRYKKALEELNDGTFEERMLKVVILCETNYFALARKEIENLIKEQPNNEKLLECKEKIDTELGLCKK